MRTLVTPPIRRTHVPIALHGLGTATPEGLVTSVGTLRQANALDDGTVVVVGHATRIICVLQVKILKYPQWQRMQWSFGGGDNEANKVVSAVRMAGVGGEVRAAKGNGEGGTGQRWARV